MATHAHTTTASRRPAMPPGIGGRRSLAVGIAALALVAPTLASTGPLTATATPNPDADLIRLCAEFDTLEHQRHGLDYEAYPNTPEEAAFNAAEDRITAGQNALLDAIERHPPATLTGVAALARSILLEEAALHGADPHSMGGRLIWHLVEGLAEGRA